MNDKEKIEKALEKIDAFIKMKVKYDEIGYSMRDLKEIKEILEEWIKKMTEPEQDKKYEGSHFTPDIICPFCHKNIKEHVKDCIGKRFCVTAKDRSENSERLRKLYKNR